MGLLDVFFGTCLSKSAVEQPRPPLTDGRREAPLPDGASDRSSSRRSSARISNGHHRSPVRRRASRKGANAASGGDLSSLSASLGGGHRGGGRASRRDAPSVISASLVETRSRLGDDDPDAADEAALRRSDRSADGRSEASGQTELESWLEDRGRARSCRDAAGNAAPSPGPFDDNVTTVSRASKNPYSVLGLPRDVTSAREVDGRYERRLREEERAGGSDQAFADVGNAYRRIRADLRRRERGGGKERGSGTRRGGARPGTADEAEDEAREERIEARLKDHSELVRGLFAKDNAKSKRGRRGGGRSAGSSSVSTKGPVTTLERSVRSQAAALAELNLVPVEGGESNVNEQRETIHNSCFYLSLAASYLSGAGAFAEDPTASYYLATKDALNGDGGETVRMDVAALPRREKKVTRRLALQLKRAVEAAVLLVHPDWARNGVVGENVQAFSDFLVYALDSDSVLGHWAVAVFDEASGFADVYRGRRYGKAYPPTRVAGTPEGKGGGANGGGGEAFRYHDCDAATRRATTLTLRYIPGHYQPLLPELTRLAAEREERGEEGGRRRRRRQRPALEDVLGALERHEVLHVVTDGRA